MLFQPGKDHELGTPLATKLQIFRVLLKNLALQANDQMFNVELDVEKGFMAFN